MLGATVSQEWIQNSENNLKQLRQLLEATDQDRLSLVRVMRFALSSLSQSVAGWLQWTYKPEIMSNFTRNELEEMAKTLSGIVSQFIEYDIKVTEKGVNKGLAKRRITGERVRFVI
jgi:hypothetical protein